MIWGLIEREKKMKRNRKILNQMKRLLKGRGNKIKQHRIEIKGN